MHEYVRGLFRVIIAGQVLGQENKGSSRPHGYGTLLSKGPFRMDGYFLEGKAAGTPSNAP